LAKGYQGVAKYAKVTIICSSKIWELNTENEINGKRTHFFSSAYATTLDFNSITLLGLNQITLI
jgi:hypothetical protein